MTAPTSLPLALTIGDPAGIGPEIAVKAWQARREADVPAFVLLGDPEILSQRAHEAGLGDMATRVLAREDAASVCAIFDTALPVVALDAFPKPVAGKPDPAFAPLVEKRMGTPWDEGEKDVQLVHRGLYAEYNLVYDRGTKFGLETGHDANAVLMSLPPMAKWV